MARKIVERSQTPDGIEIVLEDWSSYNNEEYPDLYGFQIMAYPVAQRSLYGYAWIKSGENFLITISNNKYENYTNEDVISDYNALKSGTKKLQDLSDHFWNGKRDMWYLGMDGVKKSDFGF